MTRTRPPLGAAGFTLLPVIFAMTLIAALAFLLNRDNAVNNEMTLASNDRERARYAAEAGLQAANYAVQSAGCGGGFPVSASPVADAAFGGAAYSAYASSSSGSPVTLTSTGTYNGISVTLTRASVYVYQSGVRTWVTQPGTFTGKQTYINKSSPNLNYGAEPVMRLDQNKYEMLMQFTLTPLPSKSQVVPWYDATAGKLQPGATVSLFQQIGTAEPGTINVYLTNRSWVAGTKIGTAPADGATWNTYDGSNAWISPGVGYDSRILSTFADPGAAGWQDLDVTNAVQGWLNGEYPNYGVWLRAATSHISANVYVANSDAYNLGQRPKLTAYYLLRCGASAPGFGINTTLYPEADTYLKRASAGDDNYGDDKDFFLYTLSATEEYRPVLRFDLSSIPPGTDISSATLRINFPANLTGATFNPKVIYAYRLTQSWVEGNGGHSDASWTWRFGSTTWTTAGGTYATPSVAQAEDETTGDTPTPAWRKGVLAFDLRALVQGWVDGTVPNNGVILISAVADKMTGASRENDTVANRPQLVVSY